MRQPWAESPPASKSALGFIQELDQRSYALSIIMFFTEEKGLIISPLFISYSSIFVSITHLALC